MPIIWTLNCFQVVYIYIYIYSIIHSTYSIFSPKSSIFSGERPLDSRTWKEPAVTVQTYVPESSVSTELITSTPNPSSLVVNLFIL